MENLMMTIEMEEDLLVGGEYESMDLPPGFRFHPTDEELITHYLYPKVVDNSYCARAIGEVDLNKCEPWDLPRKAKMGEKEWYFFVQRDRKYPTGLRTNRATEKGYWKATGKDKEIFRGKSLVGMKKTLVFYKGRAPKGEKSNWVIHEYRLEGKSMLDSLPSSSKGLSQNEWVICRVFQKNPEGKKIPLPGLILSNPVGNDSDFSGNMPTLMESSPYKTPICLNSKQGQPNVPCFSNDQKNIFTNQTNQFSFSGGFNNNTFTLFTSDQTLTDYSSMVRDRNPIMDRRLGQFQGNYLYDQEIFESILKNKKETEMKQRMKTEAVNFSASQDDTTGCLSNDMNAEISSVYSNYEMDSRPLDYPLAPPTSVGPFHLDDFWNY